MARTLDRIGQAPLLLLAILAANLFSAAIGLNRANLRAGIGPADAYWTQFWLTSYQDGFVRRGLLGSGLRLVFENGTSVAALAAIQVAVSAALLALVMALAWRWARKTAPSRVAVGYAALVGFSPLGPLLYETAGDPLHVAFLIYLGALLITEGAGRARLALLALAALPCLMIHEAATFFVLPHLAWTWGEARGAGLLPRAAAALGAVIVVSLAVALVANDSAGTPTFFLANGLDGGAIRAEAGATPRLQDLLRDEVRQNFGSLVGLVKFGAKCLTFAAVPLLLIAAARAWVGAGAGLAATFVLYLAASAPLYPVAHDWGRFAALSLVMALATVATSRTPAPLWPRLSATPPTGGRALAGLIAAILVAAALLPWGDTRIVGSRSALILAVLAAAGLAAWRLRPAARAPYAGTAPSA